MNTPKKTETLETYETAEKRHLEEVRGKTKSRRTDQLLAKQLTRADYQRAGQRWR